MTETGAPHLRGRRGGHHGGTIDNYMMSDRDRDHSNPHPVVYSELLKLGAPIILIYGNYDVQAPEPLDLWESPRGVKALGFDIKITVLPDSPSMRNGPAAFLGRRRVRREGLPSSLSPTTGSSTDQSG